MVESLLMVQWFIKLITPGGAISYSSMYSTTGVAMAVLCAIESMGL